MSASYILTEGDHHTVPTISLASTNLTSVHTKPVKQSHSTMKASDATKNLKSAEELSKLVSKSLAHVIRFSTNQDLKQTCLKLLNVNNSFEAEKVLCKQLDEWEAIEPNDCNVATSGEAQHKHRLDEFTNTIVKDLDDWE